MREPLEVNGFILQVKDSLTFPGCFVITAKPVETCGVFAYAYRTHEVAFQVMEKLALNFDVGTYRANFSSSSNPTSISQRV